MVNIWCQGPWGPFLPSLYRPEGLGTVRELRLGKGLPVVVLDATGHVQQMPVAFANMSRQVQKEKISLNKFQFPGVLKPKLSYERISRT